MWSLRVGRVPTEHQYREFLTYVTEYSKRKKNEQNFVNIFYEVPIFYIHFLSNAWNYYNFCVHSLQNILKTCYIFYFEVFQVHHFFGGIKKKILRPHQTSLNVLRTYHLGACVTLSGKKPTFFMILWVLDY